MEEGKKVGELLGWSGFFLLKPCWFNHSCLSLWNNTVLLTISLHLKHTSRDFLLLDLCHWDDLMGNFEKILRHIFFKIYLFIYFV